MDADTTELRGRAAQHAALADVLRLRIVDALSAGDLTVREVRAAVGGVPANLLSHHLRVLEQAGLISRRRSDADGRSRYLRLLAVRDPVPSVSVAVRRVLFICTGNTARSPLAAAVWRVASPIAVESAGTQPGAALAAEAIRIADERGLPIARRSPRSVADVRLPGDLLVTLCDRARLELGDRSGLHWSLPNPTTIGTPAAYRATVAELAERIPALVERVRAA